MKKWLGPVCLALGTGFLLWYTVGYISLAYLTKHFIKDMRIVLLIEGYLHALWSVPGVVGIAMTVIGAILVRKQKRNV